MIAVASALSVRLRKCQSVYIVARDTIVLKLYSSNANHGVAFRHTGRLEHGCA